MQINKTYLKSLYKVLTLYYIGMAHILKKQTQNRYFEILKNCQIWGPKKHLKNVPK